MLAFTAAAAFLLVATTLLYFALAPVDTDPSAYTTFCILYQLTMCILFGPVFFSLTVNKLPREHSGTPESQESILSYRRIVSKETLHMNSMQHQESKGLGRLESICIDSKHSSPDDSAVPCTNSITLPKKPEEARIATEHNFAGIEFWCPNSGIAWQNKLFRIREPAAVTHSIASSHHAPYA
jgi:hypothetical protein